MFDNVFNLEEYKRERNIAIRNLYRGEIDTSFLVKIFNKVFDGISKDLFKYYAPPTFSMKDAIAKNNDSIESDICKIIIGIHKSNMIFVPKSEQRAKIQDSAYEKELISQVIDHIKLRKHGSSFFREKQIVAGDRFLYFSLPYDLFVICIEMNKLLNENKDKTVPHYSIFSKITNKGLSALSLLENNFMDDIYVVCRGLIEYCTILIAIWKNKGATEKYTYFSQLEVKYLHCGEVLPQEFYDMFYNRKKGSSKQEAYYQYLHYGWVDELRDYHRVVDKNPYTIKGLFKYLSEMNKYEVCKIYDEFYDKCNSFVHANPIGSKYPLLSFFEISIMLYNTIVLAYDNLCKVLGVKTKVENVDMIEKSQRDYELLISQYNKRTTQNFENYYKKD